MHSLDRVMTSLEGHMPDQVPCMPILDTYHTPKLLGLKLSEAYRDGEKMARAQLEAHQQYGVDGVEVGLGPSKTPENMLGCRVIYPEDDVPIFTDPPIKNPSDLDHIAMPLITKQQLIPARSLSHEIGNRVFILGTVSAPFEYACILHGFNQTLKDLKFRPDFILSLLQETTEISRIVGEALICNGAHGIKLKDSAASPTIISPSDYRKFAQPFERKIIKSVQRLGAKSILHICTNSTQILQDMKKTEADAVEIDHQVDLDTARQLVGSDLCIKGNLASVELVLHGSSDEITRSVGEAILKAGSNGSYIVSSGDSVPRDAPINNVNAIVEATRKLGGYPISNDLNYSRY